MRTTTALVLLSAAILLTGCADGPMSDITNALDAALPVTNGEVDRLEQQITATTEAMGKAASEGDYVGTGSLGLTLLILGGLYGRRVRRLARTDSEKIAVGVAARPIQAPDGGLVTQEDIAKVVRPRAAAQPS